MRKSTDFNVFAVILMITGVTLKAYYVISKIRNREYVPGYEVGLFFTGLLMFLSGLYLRAHDAPFNPAFLIVPGILMKAGFIVVFIVKIKRRSSMQAPQSQQQ